MKAIYREATIILCPETDSETDQLLRASQQNVYKINRITIGEYPAPCFEFVVGMIIDDAGKQDAGTGKPNAAN